MDTVAVSDAATADDDVAVAETGGDFVVAQERNTAVRGCDIDRVSVRAQFVLAIRNGKSQQEATT